MVALRAYVPSSAVNDVLTLLADSPAVHHPMQLGRTPGGGQRCSRPTWTLRPWMPCCPADVARSVGRRHRARPPGLESTVGYDARQRRPVVERQWPCLERALHDVATVRPRRA